MAVGYWWWLLALALGILELVTGTFYLLVLALGCAAAGVAAFAGVGATGQYLVAAAVAAGGALWVRRMRPRGERAGAQRNRDVLLDVGERVRVERWGEDRRARIDYRGTQWTAELARGEPAVPGEFTIREIEGNRLIVGRADG